MRTARLMWKMILYRPLLYFVNGLCWSAVHVLPLFIGLVNKLFFDYLAGETAAGMNVATVLALLVATSLARVTALGLGAWADAHHRFSMSALIRRNMLFDVMQRPGAEALRCSTGEALSYFRDDAEQVEDSISWTLDIIGNGVFAVAALWILLSISPRVTFFVFLPLVVVMLVFNRATHIIERLRRESREATARVTGFIGELFTAVQAVQLADAEERMIAELERLSEERRRLMLRDRALNFLLDSVSSNVVSIGTGFILLLASREMSGGSFSVGDFALFVYYLDHVAEFSEFFGYFLAKFKQTTVSFDRMAEFLQGRPAEALVAHNDLGLRGGPRLTPEYAAAERDEFRELEVRGLTHNYGDGEVAIRGVDLCVRRGEFVVVTGRIGSGKSTLLKVILGLLTPSNGEILWNGKPVTDPNTFFGPPRTAYTGQTPMLFSDSIKGNILLGCQEDTVGLAEAVHDAVLEQDLAGMEQGLDTMVGSRGVRLSGGQVQRVAAARMLARQASLLLFDDLSSALDVETEAQLWERIFNRRSVTCLVVSHRRPALRRADRIIVLKDGSVHDSGRLEELLHRCEEMQLLWLGHVAGNN